ncbi:MAG: gluconate 2-dehydrogenase subunit 3 family protein [Armatimonadetes bacterium]|nr:gluconate 2-dehydrogenase subunit 3 family protein [Armatimonadota bacterium]
MEHVTPGLTDKQIETLAAVMNRIVPPDDFPGAWEVGAGEYLLRQFEKDLPEMLPLYRLGLDGLDAEAWVTHEREFARLSTHAQDALLARVEAGKVKADWLVPPVQFFALLVRHTMEGYYADPGNGGNREGIAWRMIGFEVRG